MVKLYALSTCIWCKKTKTFLKDNDIAFDLVEVDLAEGEDREAALAEMDRLAGQRTFPVVVIDEVVVVGFKPDEIKEALAGEK